MKHHSEILLSRALVEDLRNAVAELERRADSSIENALSGDRTYVAPSLEVREGIFQLLALVAGLEEDLRRRFRELVAEYLEQIYAFHAKLEEDLEAPEGSTRKTIGDDPVI